MFKVVPLSGRDKYIGGEGEMLVKLAGLVNVANDRGAKIDQGAMLRYLKEGDFTFFRWEIVDVEINRPALYDDGAPGRASTFGPPHGGAGARSRSATTS